MDGKKIEEAVKLLLEGMGEDAEREGLKDTPARVARAFEEVFSGYKDSAEKHLSVTFESGSGGMVLEKESPFIPCANITFFLFSERRTWLIFRKAELRD